MMIAISRIYASFGCKHYKNGSPFFIKGSASETGFFTAQSITGTGAIVKSKLSRGATIYKRGNMAPVPNAVPLLLAWTAKHPRRAPRPRLSELVKDGIVEEWMDGTAAGIGKTEGWKNGWMGRRQRWRGHNKPERGAEKNRCAAPDSLGNL